MRDRKTLYVERRRPVRRVHKLSPGIRLSALALGAGLLMVGTGVAPTVAGATGAAGTAGAAGAASASQAIGQQPRFPTNTKTLGSLAGSTPMRLEVMLRPRDDAALQSFIASVSDPTSPDHGHYLARGQFGPRFGPSNATVAKVTEELRGFGLQVGSPSSDRLVLPVSGTEAQVASVFHTSIDRFRLASGRNFFSNVNAPMLPGTVSGYVSGVIGISNLSKEKPTLIHASPTSSAPSGTGHSSSALAAPALTPLESGSSPCVAATNIATHGSSFTFNTIANAYDFTAAYTKGQLGSGQTIALFELEPHNTSNVTTFDSCYTLPVGDHYGTVTNLPLAGFSAGAKQSGEAILDIEVVEGLAPEANVLVYEAPNTNLGALTEYETIVSQDRAQVISTSWGDCEALAKSTAQTESGFFEEAAAQGQSVFAAAGDSGSEDCYRTTPTTGGQSTVSLAVDDPASQPFVTGVGGTTMTKPGNGGSTPPSEVVWNERASSSGAGGGGVSSIWAKPSWQSVTGSSPPTGHCTVTPNSVSHTTSCRQVPDVAASSDPLYGDVVYCSTGTGCGSGRWTVFGGTSDAAPLWAAFTALTNEGCGTDVGFLNPRLYALGSGIQHDITAGTNDYLNNHGGLYAAGVGYDNASGWGTPNGANFFSAACETSVGTTSVHLSTNVAGNTDATYTASFITSTSGALSGGDSITLTAAQNTGWPSLASDYLVNTVAATAVTLSFYGNSSLKNIVTIQIPQAVAADQAVTLAVAGVTSPKSVGAEFLSISTSVDLATQKAAYAIVEGVASGQRSSLTASKSVLPVHGIVTVTVTLRNAFGVSIPSAPVTLSVGSSHTATVTSSVATTNQQGKALFKVSDSVPESFVVSATATNGAVVITQTAPVTFKGSTSSGPGAPSNGHITGYWLVGSDGGIFTFGDAHFYGSEGSQPLNKPIVGIASTSDGHGYWLVASDGGIFTFGDANFFGSTGALPLNKPIVSIAPTQDGNGYWLVASDGGIFAFGDAGFFGSTGALHLNKPIVGMASTPDAHGYWLVASDGGIFAFGDAGFFGSTGGIHLNQPIVSMAPNPDGNGYWLVASDGGIFAFGDAAFFGSTGAITLISPIVGMTASPDGAGYDLLAADGGIFAFGDFPFFGSTGSTVLVAPIVGTASTTT